MRLVHLSLLHTTQGISLQMAYSENAIPNCGSKISATTFRYDISSAESMAIEQGVRTIMQSSSAVRLVEMGKLSLGGSAVNPAPSTEEPGKAQMKLEDSSMSER